MKPNVIVKTLVVLLVLALVGLVVSKRGGDPALDGEGVLAVGGEPIDAQTQAALALEADTPTDTIKTLISGQRAQRGELAALQAENEALLEGNSRLLNMKSELAGQIESGLQRKIHEVERRQAQALDKMQRLMTAWIDKQARMPDPKPLDLGGGAPPAAALTPPGAITDSEGTVWIPPLEAATTSAFQGLDRDGPLASLLTLTGRGQNSERGERGVLDGAAASIRVRSGEPVEKPAYTIAKNSTLVGATAMTALVGRVPVGNNVVDPYSFKVIVGRENLIANGKTVPELAYAVVSGKAIGDWTLGCVSGKVYSITFVFGDGRIRTLPSPADVAPGTETTPDLMIGELADDYGNPCVVGRKITNAGKYLAQQVLATTAEAAALAAAASQTTTSVGALGGVTGSNTTVTGDRSQFVLDHSLAGAARETAQWIRERSSLEFDAVYVRPGAKVAVHVTEELRIDYEEQGRFTHHDDFGLQARHRPLD